MLLIVTTSGGWSAFKEQHVGASLGAAVCPMDVSPMEASIYASMKAYRPLIIAHSFQSLTAPEAGLLIGTERR
jgi:hypothetical protein